MEFWVHFLKVLQDADVEWLKPIRNVNGNPEETKSEQGWSGEGVAAFEVTQQSPSCLFSAEIPFFL